MPNLEAGTRRFCGAALRFAALIAPQLIVSAIALWGFTRAFYLRTDFGWLHLPLIAALQCAFYATWGLVAGSRPGKARVTPYLFAALLWAKTLAINGVYVASAATNAFWGDNFTMENIASARIHLIGLHAAFGRIVPLCVAGTALGMLGSAALFLKCAPSLYRRLQWGTLGSGPLCRRTGPAIATVCSAAAAFAVLGCWMQISLTAELRRDPLFSFWLQLEPARDPVGALADTQARQAYPVVPAFDRKNVFIFSVDSLRSDHLPMGGYARDTSPFLQELQRAGLLVVAERGVSVGNSSPQGMFGILMSRYPEKQQPGAFMLPELLKLQGYRTAAYMAGDKSTFAGARRFFGHGFDVFIDGPVFRSHSVNDDAGVLEALETLPPSDGTPVFILFHLMSAHVLGVRLPEFARWSPSHYDARYANSSYTFEPEFARNTYDNRILQTDDYLRRICSVLEAKGYLKNYIAVVTSDHGEGLGEHGNYGHGRCLFHEDIGVPILFAGSSRPPVDAPLASQIDIAPTVLSVLGLPIPSVWDGVPLTRGAGRDTVFLSSRRVDGWRGVIRQDLNGAFKYLFFGPANGEWREALFDLRSDPEEGHDLIRNPPRATLNALRQLAAAHFRVPIPPDVLRTGERTSPDLHHDAAGE